jgi:hypothetical protein
MGFWNFGDAEDDLKADITIKDMNGCVIDQSGVCEAVALCSRSVFARDLFEMKRGNGSPFS